MDAAYQERLMESRARLFPELLVEISNPEKNIKNNINNKNYNFKQNINQGKINVTSQDKVNNINAHARDYRGLKRRINSDKDFVMVLDEWAVHEPFLYAATRDFGEQRVKDIIFRIGKLRDGYFRQGYGPIPTQRGRLLNHEISMLRKERLKA